MTTLTMPKQALVSGSDAAQLVDQARAEMELSRFAEARVLLEAALDATFGRPDVRALLAECLFLGGNPLDAAEEWAQLLSEKPEDLEARLWLIRIDPLVTAVKAVHDRNPDRIQISIRDGLTCVSLGGVVASRTESRNLTQQYTRITNAIGQAAAIGVTQCIVDMERVTFVSSYFHSLVGAWVRILKPVGRQIVLAGTRDDIRQALVATDLQRMVRFASSIDSARSCFAPH